jgi:hypothetical protein
MALSTFLLVRCRTPFRAALLVRRLAASARRLDPDAEVVGGIACAGPAAMTSVLSPLRHGLMVRWSTSGCPDALAAELARTVDEAREAFHVTVRASVGQGDWRDRPPADVDPHPLGGGPVAVLTRGLVRWRSVPRWYLRGLPTVDRQLRALGDHVISVGFTDRPLRHAITFSVWPDVDTMRSFAYGTDGHGHVHREATEDDWFSDSEFVRFSVVDFAGTWLGRSIKDISSRSASGPPADLGAVPTDIVDASGPPMD